jgi:hypothetical protein
MLREEDLHVIYPFTAVVWVAYIPLMLIRAVASHPAAFQPTRVLSSPSHRQSLADTYTNLLHRPSITTDVWLE